MDRDNMNSSDHVSLDCTIPTDKYCLVIIEKGLPVFVSMAMPKHSCETMKVAIGEGEIVPSDLGLTYKRMMTNIPTGSNLQKLEVRQKTPTFVSGGCLVICQDRGIYYVATRQLMTAAQAEEYIKGVSSDRYPIIVHANTNWDLRQPKG